MSENASCGKDCIIGMATLPRLPLQLAPLRQAKSTTFKLSAETIVRLKVRPEADEAEGFNPLGVGVGIQQQAA